MITEITGWQDERYFGTMTDGGPVYAETNIENFIAEPWNAASSLLLILPALYWFIKLRGQFNTYTFLAYCMPLLVLGGLGSTLFHAFRSSSVFLIMDVLPTAILTLSIGIYFWVKVLPKWWYILLIIGLSILLRWLADLYWSPHTAINISYAITGVTIFLPILILSGKYQFKNITIILISIFSLFISLVFREFDARYSFDILPMGTHFLWHSFSAVGAFYLAKYLYIVRKIEINSISDNIF